MSIYPLTATNSPSNKLSNKVFSELLQTADRDTLDDTELVGLVFNLGSVTLNIYGKASDDYKLEIEEFGNYKNIEGKQVGNDLSLTFFQTLLLKKILKKHVEEVLATEKENNHYTEMNRQEAEDELTFGIAGAIYAKSF